MGAKLAQPWIVMLMEETLMRVTHGIYGFFMGFLCSLPIAAAFSVGISCIGDPGGPLLGVENTPEGWKGTNTLAIHGTALLLPLVIGVLGFQRNYGESGRAQRQKNSSDAPVDCTLVGDIDPGTALEKRLRCSNWRVPTALLYRDTRRAEMSS
jgi:hypothetical protein